MGKYTMELGELIENKVDIFDFDYTFYREDMKKQFEQSFIDYFYYDEIGSETVAKFKHRLKTKLTTILPYWNKIYESQEIKQRITDTYHINEKYEKSNTNNNRASSNTVNKNLYKDAPKTKIDIDKFDIVNSINKDINENTTNNFNENKEQWERNVVGNTGNLTDADTIIKHWNSLRKVNEEIFEKELSKLFMEVY